MLYFIAWSGLIVSFSEICVLQLFVIQFLTSQILRFMLDFLWSHFSRWPKYQNKNNKNKKSFSDKVKSIFHNF